MTYLQLKNDIEEHAKRGDLGTNIDRFIAYGEVDIWEKLRVREMEARATATTPTTSRFLALPSGFIKMRRLTLTYNNRPYTVGYVIPENLEVWETAGVPSIFTVGTQLEFNRIADQGYVLEMKYWKKPTAITAGTPTNDVLTNYPGIYLAASMKYFGLWSLQDDVAGKWDGFLDEEIARANRPSRQGRYGSSPTKSLPGMVV